MIKAFKDQLKVNLFLTVLFYAGIAASIYALYRLPNNLMIPYGFESAFTSVYITVAITFLFGIGAISQAMKYKKELVVFRDRTSDVSQAETDSANESRSTITIEGVKNAVSGATDVKQIFHLGLEAICKQLAAGQGAAYMVKQDEKYAELLAGYALSVNENSSLRYNFGEGLIGQAAASGQPLYLDELPEGYIKIISGLGSASPRYLFISPVLKQNSVVGILEIAAFSPISADQKKFIEQSSQLLADKLSTK